MRVTAVETLTGVPITSLEVSEGSWKSSLTMPGDGSVTIPVRDMLAPVPSEIVGLLRRGWATTIVIESAGIDYAGVVVGDVWSPATGLLTLELIELGALLAHRLLFGVSQYATGTKRLRGRDLGHVLREAFRWALVEGDRRWRLPVDLPSWVDGPVERLYERFNFESAAQFIEQLTGEDGAPDVFLRPGWSGDRLRWTLEVGTPLLNAGEFEWDVATHAHRVKTPVVDPVVTSDYRGQRTGMFVLGSGSEEDMLHATAGSTEVDVAVAGPWLDSVVSAKNVADMGQLKSIALAELDAAAHGTEQWQFGVETGDLLDPVGRPRVGSVVRLRHPGDEVVGAGTRLHYVLEVAGTVGGTRLTLGTQQLGVIQ